MHNYTQKWIIIHKCDKRCLPIVHWTSTIELSALFFVHIYSRFMHIFVFLFTFVYNYSRSCKKWKCIIIHCSSRFVQSSSYFVQSCIVHCTSTTELSAAGQGQWALYAVWGVWFVDRSVTRAAQGAKFVAWQTKNGTAMGTVLRIIVLLSFVCCCFGLEFSEFCA